MNPSVELSPAVRHPLLSNDAQKLLLSLHEHPAAPRFNALCGDRLDQRGLAEVASYEDLVNGDPPNWQPGTQPAWVAPWLARTLPRVAAFAELPTEVPLQQLPTCRRADLSRDICAYVANDVPLENLVVHQTFGTTGDRLVVPWTPQACAMYLPLMRRALALVDVDLPALPGRIGVLMACWQQTTVVVASVASYLGEAGFLKLNLHPSAWRQPGDALAYLQWAKPYLITGDPLSFQTLLELAPQLRPAALISSSMQLTPALAQALQDQFHCPVVDLYSCNETGPIAARAAASGASSAWTLLQPQLLVEIVDEQGRALPPQTRGEICVSGGFNPYLPLLRYRTGDFAALQWRGEQPTLIDLQGRAPVLLEHADGRQINNIDVSVALKPFPIARFRLTQKADRSLRLEVDSGASEDALRAAIAGVLGALPLQISALSANGKVLQFVREAR